MKSSAAKISPSDPNESGGAQDFPIPELLPLIPVRDLVVFPHMILPLIVGRNVSLSAIAAALNDPRKLVFLAAQREMTLESPTARDIYTTGTAATIMRTRQLPDGRMKILVQGLKRGKIEDFVQSEPYFQVKIRCKEEGVEENSLENEALLRHIREKLERVISCGKSISPDILVAMDDLDKGGRIADLVASSLSLKVSELQAVLETEAVTRRLRYVSDLLTRELELLAVQARLRNNTLSEMNRERREILRDMKELKNELPQDDLGDEIRGFRKKIEAEHMPREAREEALKQLRRLEQMHPETTEASVVRTYLDWLVELPWDRKTEDRLDLDSARAILDADHYDMKSVKERILEFLAVCKLRKEMRGPILCFIGPPGVGKTSLGKSIAKAMGRKFVRASFGGLRDEAEIRGHRKTYVGAMPGRIIAGLKNAGTKNPVFMLDEIDKLGMDMRGDPAAALLEVLDPEQNHSFRDYYLNVDFDLSSVLFIATANVGDTITPALRDRMEIIHLSGYSIEEKQAIAKTYLIPKQIEAHGIDSKNVTFSEEGIAKLITDYTREAGVRNLEREIGAVCRKMAVKIASGKSIQAPIDTAAIKELLGIERFSASEYDWTDHEAGVATGLAWTPYGGEAIHIEASSMAGKGGMILTGQLGEIMQESAKAAMGFVRANARLLGIDERIFREREIHIHIPAGAIPKDGPSAGVPIAIAILSLLTGKKVRKEIAFTGEITLKGKVLGVGGIKEKVLAAHRAGLTHLFLPLSNRKDLEELPSHIFEDLEMVFIRKIEEVIQLAFVPEPRLRLVQSSSLLETDSKVSSL